MEAVFNELNEIKNPTDLYQACIDKGFKPHIYENLEFFRVIYPEEITIDGHVKILIVIFNVGSKRKNFYLVIQKPVLLIHPFMEKNGPEEDKNIIKQLNMITAFSIRKRVFQDHFNGF